MTILILMAILTTTSHDTLHTTRDTRHMTHAHRHMKSQSQCIEIWKNVPLLIHQFPSMGVPLLIHQFGRFCFSIFFSVLSLDDGRRTTDDGWQTTDDGQRTTGDRQQMTDDGRRTTDGGRRTTNFEASKRCHLFYEVVAWNRLVLYFVWRTLLQKLAFFEFWKCMFCVCAKKRWQIEDPNVKVSSVWKKQTIFKKQKSHIFLFCSL